MSGVQASWRNSTYDIIGLLFLLWTLAWATAVSPLIPGSREQWTFPQFEREGVLELYQPQAAIAQTRTQSRSNVVEPQREAAVLNRVMCT